MKVPLLIRFVFVILLSSIMMTNTALFFCMDRQFANVLFQTGTQPDFVMQIEPGQFLMRSGTTMTPGIVFTPLNGFIGNVNISATISPQQPSAPTISLFPPSSIMLNASLSGSPAYFVTVTAKTSTELGLYTLTVTGSSGALAHFATATVGVTSVSVPANGADLLYKGKFTQVAYSGGSTILNSTFTDLGYVGIGVTNLTITTSFGTFQHTKPYAYNDCPPQGPPPGQVCMTVGCFGPCPIVTLSSFGKGEDSLSIQIPQDTSPGNYSVTAIISWVLQPGTIYEKSAPNSVAHGYVMVYAKPVSQPSPPPSSQPSIPQNIIWEALNRLLDNLFPILAGVSLIALVTVSSLIWNRRRSRNQISRDHDPFYPIESGIRGALAADRRRQEEEKKHS